MKTHPRTLKDAPTDMRNLTYTPPQQTLRGIEITLGQMKAEERPWAISLNNANHITFFVTTSRKSRDKQ